MNEIISIDIQNKLFTATDTNLVGKIGEDFAAGFLERNGFRLVVKNFKVPIGRNRRGVQVSGEIDVIALDGGILCFIEVKTRTSDEFASPLSAVDLRKQRQIIRTARIYRKVFRLENQRFRYDAVSVVLNKKKAPKIEIFKSFWNEEKFNRKRWNEDYY